MQQPEALPRRTLQELRAIHRLDQTVHDIIVEGISDKTIIDWFLEASRKQNFEVYEVSRFEVDPQLVVSYGLQDNNRGRVIAIAYHLAQSFQGNIRVTCIADRDFDLVLDIEIRNRLLLLTDYVCMLMYTFNERTLNKFLRLRVRRFSKPARRALQDITAMLQSLFAIRLANHLLELGLQPVDWRRSCGFGDGRPEFDISDYIARYLNKNRRPAERERFVAKVRECEARGHADPRFQIRGHDFIAVLIWYVSQHPGFRAFARVPEETVEQELLTCLELQDLAQETLFQQLLTRV
jgi:hypothetical protein